ncbi:MAG: type II secretion system protein GspM [Actinomycetota bacterium]|nr:type II secretion system protein GspM [Actinomycetota bacterium]
MRNSPLLKILVPAALLLGALVFYQDVYVKSTRKLSDLKDSASATATSLSKYRRLVSSTPALNKRLAQMRETRDNLQEDLFQGQSLSITSASLQDAVKKIITAGGGAISSEKTGRASITGKFVVVTAGFEVNLPDTNALTNILYQLKANKPSIVVKEMYVRCVDTKNPKALTASLTVAALTGVPGNDAGTGMDTIPMEAGPLAGIAGGR